MISNISRATVGLAALIALGLFCGCASTRVSGSNVTALGLQTAYLVSDRPLDDFTVATAIATELRNRGFRVIDSGSNLNADSVDGLVVRYLDVWRWDLKMFMCDLNIRILDGRTSEMLATATYNTSGLHAFPDPQSVVSDLFKKLDSKGVFPATPR